MIPMRKLIGNSTLISLSLSITLIASVFQYIQVAKPQTAEAASFEGWQIIMMTPGKKPAVSTIASGTALSATYGAPGNSNFSTANATTSSATSRTAFGAGEGVYSAFYNMTGITKVALVDGSSSSMNPTAHNNYLIYNLVESTGSESLNAILKRLDGVLNTANISNNDTVWGSSSVLNLTAGTSGYSGTLASSGGTAFKTSVSGSVGNVNVTPTKFAVMGINRDSDNDIQALAFYAGDLNLGKGDSWRGLDPYETFWSYWGNDFHTTSLTQRIGAGIQTTPGVSTGASYTGNVYLMAFSAVATTIDAPTISGTPYKGLSVTLSATVNTSSIVRFFVNGKRIANCKDKVTSGTSPNNVATCPWKPSVSGAQRVTATATPTTQGLSTVTSSALSVFVERRQTTR
jgi:hypothetical protein